MSTKDRVNVFLRHRFHVLRKLDLLTSQEISRVFGMGPNATPINQALLKLFNAGLVTRLMRKPSNTYEWRTSTITVAPTDAELQCLPPELVVQLEREEAALKKAPTAQQIPIPEAADLHRAGLPTVVVPAPSFEPPVEPIVDLNNRARAYLRDHAYLGPVSDAVGPVSDAADLSAAPVVIGVDLGRETQAAEYRADMTAAALEAPDATDLQEPGEPAPEAPDAENQPAITTLSDVLERYRARQYDRLHIDEDAIMELARVIVSRAPAMGEAVWITTPTWPGGNIHAAFGTPAGIVRLATDLALLSPLATEKTRSEVQSIAAGIDDALSKAMKETLERLGPPSRVHVSQHVLWALEQLAPALPPPIGMLLREAHGILSMPLAPVA